MIGSLKTITKLFKRKQKIIFSYGLEYHFSITLLLIGTLSKEQKESSLYKDFLLRFNLKPFFKLWRMLEPKQGYEFLPHGNVLYLTENSIAHYISISLFFSKALEGRYFFLFQNVISGIRNQIQIYPVSEESLQKMTVKQRKEKENFYSDKKMIENYSNYTYLMTRIARYKFKHNKDAMRLIDEIMALEI